MTKKILYDSHSGYPIELYYHIDTCRGKNTCKAMCEHCTLQSNVVTSFRQELGEAKFVISELRKQRYHVLPIVSESFTENGIYLKSNLFKNQNFFLGSMAWSSGLPLVHGDSDDLLSLMVENNMNILAMTSHGTHDNECPFKGVVKPSVVRQAVDLVKAFNAKHSQNIQMSMTFTIGQWNKSYNTIKGYFDYCRNLGINFIRINRFLNWHPKYNHLKLSHEDVALVYRNLKQVNDECDDSLQLSVSEDFGKHGVEVMGFPKGVGHCAAGQHLFGVLYPDVYVCPVISNIKVGTINNDMRIVWDHEKLARIKEAKQLPDYDGCFGNSYFNVEHIRKIIYSNE